MVLVKKLSEEEKRAHISLVRQYFQEMKGNTDVKVSFFDNGSEKGVYEVIAGEEKYLAAVARSENDNRRLLTEYNVLSQLYGAAPQFFPRPLAHYAPQDVRELGDLLLMEQLPHKNLMKVERSKYKEGISFFRDLSYHIGQAVAQVQLLTGRFPYDLHDGNVLVKISAEGDDLELKFCDAAQFRSGSLRDAAEAILNNKYERPECTRFIIHFRQGMTDAVSATLNMDLEDAWEQFDYFKNYNDIFPV